jgi:MoaA/NifB/PqqE/SkfB family radical SAM enzyme
MHLQIETTGDIQPCCNTISRADINPKQTKTMNVNYDKIGDVWNSEFFKTLRKEMLSGVEPKICKNCFHTERLGNRSMRTDALFHDDYYNNVFKNISSQILKSKKTDGYTELKPTSIDIRLGNLCNLKCRMCNSASSSQLNDENKILSKTHTDNRFVVHDDALFDWPTRKSFWKDFNKNTPDLNKIYFVGGEPTLQEEHYKLLERLILTNKAKNIILQYNINCTNVQNRFIKLVNEFKQVTISLSIDGIGKLNNYIRHPSKWNNIEANVDRLIYETKSNVRLLLTPTLQALNALNFIDIFEWFIEKQIALEKDPSIIFRRRPDDTPGWYEEPKMDIFLNIAFVPEHASFYAIPISIRTQYINNNKERIAQLLETLSHLLISKMDSNNVRLKMGIQKYISFMLEKHEASTTEFINYTKILDKHRNESLFDVLPEYKQHFS